MSEMLRGEVNVINTKLVIHPHYFLWDWVNLLLGFCLKDGYPLQTSFYYSEGIAR